MTTTPSTGTTAALAVRDEPFDAVQAEWSSLLQCLPEQIPFVSPVFQQCWLEHFQGERTVRAYTARDNGRLVGVAPMIFDGASGGFVGHHSICDYMDVAIEPGAEHTAWPLLLERIADDGATELDLRGLLESSPTIEAACAAAPNAGWHVERHDEAISPGVDLPASWDDYLGRLSKKDRHEMRRKMRRLSTAGGEVTFRVVTDGAEGQALLERFFHLMRISNHHKEEFLARPGMQEFFHDIVGRMANAGMLRFHWLDFEGLPVAGVLNFDLGGRLYMYNSGYDTEYASMAIGLMSKALLIEEAITSGRTFVDFMRGDESYKYDLGGKDRKVVRLVLTR
jgi:CelD/BcsL family acetyltransferase involved in cellulose biosynthesis